jgi:predicted dehydrogenase
VLGDLATHPVYISEVILPHLRIRRLLCARQSFVKTRAPLEYNAVTLMEYDSGAFGTVWTSAVNAGATHSQKVRIIGSKPSIEWWDERPNQLSFEIQDQPARILERGMDYLDAAALAEDRIGAGPPEGLFEAWANL